MTPNQEATFETIELEIKKEKPRLGDRLLLSLIFLVASVYLPLAIALPLPATAREAFAFLVCALSVLAQARLSKKIGTGIGQAVVLFLIGALFGGLEIAALVGSLISVASIFCWLTLTTSSLIPLAFPLAAYVTATAFVGSPFLGALSLIGMPLALFLLLSVRLMLPKVRAICLLSLGVGLSAIITLVLYMLLAHNSISVGLLEEGIDSLRSILAAEIELRLSLLESEMGVLPLGMEHRSYASMLANEVINHLPAILILFCNSIALITHSSMVRLLISAKIPKEPLTPVAVLDMSATSAAIFLISIGVSLFATSPDSAMTAAVCENLVLVLLPGMLITLWMFLNAWLLRKAPSCFGILLYLAIPFLFFQFSSTLLPIGAVIGAILILVLKIRKALANRKSES